MFKSPSLIINLGSGSASDISHEIEAIFNERGLPQPTIYLAQPSDLGALFERINGDGTDLLIVYGGDGTLKSGAEAAQKAEVPFIALPGGTMNLLPKALYGTDDWKTALEIALSQPAPRWQAAGRVNEATFFCGALFGDPIVISEARETLRNGEILEAIKQIPDILTAISHGERFTFKADGKVFDKASNGLQISCPSMRNDAKSETHFELASVPQLTMAKLATIGAIALADDWRSSHDVMTTLAETVTITGQGAFDILLDGEPETVSCPITINLDPKGVKVLAPKKI